MTKAEAVEALTFGKNLASNVALNSYVQIIETLVTKTKRSVSGDPILEERINLCHQAIKRSMVTLMNKIKEIVDNSYTEEEAILAAQFWTSDMGKSVQRKNEDIVVLSSLAGKIWSEEVAYQLANLFTIK